MSCRRKPASIFTGLCLWIPAFAGMTSKQMCDFSLADPALRRCRNPLAVAGGKTLRLQTLGQQESQFERLAGVEAGVAVGVVAVAQLVVGDGLGAADAFGDVLAGHLEMHAAGIGAFRLVHSEERLHLAEDT